MRGLTALLLILACDLAMSNDSYQDQHEERLVRLLGHVPDVPQLRAVAATRAKRVMRYILPICKYIYGGGKLKHYICTHDI